MIGRPSGPLDRLMACVEEAAVSTWRRRPFAAATVVAIGVTLTFPALAVVVLGWASDFVSGLAAREGVRVFLEAGVEPRQRSAVLAALEAEPAVARVSHVDAVRARADFAEAFPELAGLADELAGLDEDGLAFPESFAVSLVDADAVVEPLVERVRALPGVEDVRHDRDWAIEIRRVRRALDGASTLVAVAALAVTAFAIGNVIRINALSRREELAIMRLVGAPGYHLRVPFILEGALEGALGGLLAAGLLALLTWLLGPHLAALLPTASTGLPGGTVELLVGAPALAGTAGAALAMEGVLRRHARLQS